MTDDQARRGRYADGNPRVQQDSRVAAERRSSGQLTVPDVNPTHVCSFTLDGTPDTVFEL